MTETEPSSRTAAPSASSVARGPDEPAVLDLTIGDALRASAAAVPDQLALFGTRDERRWTFAELLGDCEALARQFVAGYGPGARIAIWGQNLPEWVLAEYAIAMAGQVIVTVNPNLTSEEAAYVFDQSEASVVLASGGYRGRDLAALARELQATSASIRDVVEFGALSELVERGRASATDLPSPRPDDLVMIQYTSGTTGFPKGACLHHRGIVTNAVHTALRNQLDHGDVMLGTMPLFHTGGSVLAVLAAGAHRCTLALVEEFDPGHILDVIEQHQLNTLAGVPTMLLAILEHPTFAERDLSSVKVITSGGSTVPAPLVERLERDVGAPFTIVFGMTEMSPVATMTYPDDSIDDKANTLGRAMPNVEIRIVDTANEPVPIGEPGEFCARGYLVMQGYNDNPDATAEAIDADGWMHSGDLCTMDDRGYCRIVGRLKDMIIRGGENIYPREIEDVLFRHPAIADVAVVGVPDDTWGEVVTAVVRLAPDTDGVTVQELRDHVRQHLAPHKTPVHWYRVEQFPLTGSGKVQKFRLVDQWGAGELVPLDAPT